MGIINFFRPGGNGGGGEVPTDVQDQLDAKLAKAENLADVESAEEALDNLGGATAVHIHTLNEISDSGSAAAADVGDFEPALGYTPEDVANKDDDPELGGETPSVIKYPNQAAVKAYIDEAIAGVAGGSADYILIQDQKTSGTAGGTFTSGAWQTRTLNTEVADTGNHASLSSNQITLAAGTYECVFSATAFRVGLHQARLQNITDTTTPILGQNEYGDNGVAAPAQTLATGRGRFTIATSKTFELQHRCAATQATDGFGKATSWGTEIYASVEFRKVA